jgi:hypothetical protein
MKSIPIRKKTPISVGALFLPFFKDGKSLIPNGFRKKDAREKGTRGRVLFLFEED